jgi:hypothetical protein
MDPDVKIDCRGADPVAIKRLSTILAKDHSVFERRVSLERALLSAMACASEMQWGRDDCALWCANILKDALGYDGAERFRKRYRTRIGARRVLGRGGIAGALRASARLHGWHRIKAGAEQVGDIGIAVLGGIPSTVICRAQGWFVGRNLVGWTAVPANLVRVIWTVI